LFYSQDNAEKNTCIKHMRTLAICRNVQLSNTALVYLIHLSDASPERLCRISNLLCPVCHFRRTAWLITKITQCWKTSQDHWADDIVLVHWTHNEGHTLRGFH